MSTNVNRPWLSVYALDRHPVSDPAVVSGPTRPMGLSPDLFAPWGEAVGSGRKPRRKGRPKPKTTKHKRRMQKASRKANRKKR